MSTIIFNRTRPIARCTSKHTVKVIFSLLLSFYYHYSAFAQQTYTGSEMTITATSEKDLYIAGGTVTINAPVHGDLIVGGGTVVINDTVTNDIIACGGKITINGQVGDDIRCGGGELLINGAVAGDIAVVSGSLTLSKSATVHGTAMVAGGNMNIDGVINGDMNASFGKLLLNGTVVNNVNLRGGDIELNGKVMGKSTLSANSILLGQNAVFSNDVRYWSGKNRPQFSQHLANAATANFDESLKIDNAKWQYLGFISLMAMLWYLLAVMVVIVLVQYLLGRFLKRAADEASSNSMASLGYGLIFIFGVPIAIVILFVTIIGIPIGLLVLMAYITILLLATITTAVMIANKIGTSRVQKSYLWRNSFTALAVFILLKLISMIPVFGWLALIGFFSIAFGGIIRSIINWRKSNQVPVKLK